jgi:hypothetical protein
MPVKSFCGRGAGADESHIARVKEFNKLYKSCIAEDDANSALLNEAVTMHLSEAKPPYPAIDDPEYVQRPLQRCSSATDNNRQR